MRILTRLAILALWASFGVHSKVEEVQIFNHNMTFGRRTLAQAADGGDFGDVRQLLCSTWVHVTRARQPGSQAARQPGSQAAR